MLIFSLLFLLESVPLILCHLSIFKGLVPVLFFNLNPGGLILVKIEFWLINLSEIRQMIIFKKYILLKLISIFTISQPHKKINRTLINSFISKCNPYFTSNFIAIDEIDNYCFCRFTIGIYVKICDFNNCHNFLFEVVENFNYITYFFECLDMDSGI